MSLASALPFRRAPQLSVRDRIRARDRAFRQMARAQAEVICVTCGFGTVKGAPSYLVKTDGGYRHGDTRFCAEVIATRDGLSRRRRLFLDLAVWARKRAA